jgi:hypothetical protein
MKAAAIALTAGLIGLGCHHGPAGLASPGRYRGTRIQPFIETYGRPTAVEAGPEGSVYIFHIVWLEQVPVPSAAPPGLLPPPLPSLAPPLLDPTRGPAAPPRQAAAAPLCVPRLRTYVVRVRTDALGIIQDLSGHRQPD